MRDRKRKKILFLQNSGAARGAGKKAAGVAEKDVSMRKKKNTVTATATGKKYGW